ncbi:hypothetical protein ACIOD2_41265 [Amycolatopsis sp. NPDC088138]|uniref:hypothetical protein n=1 Tax=Amycolatopsis sp. NPDC088138 TaxID=3363938 RepID=UPI00380BA0AE
MDTGESAAERQIFGYAGTSLLAMLAIFGAVFLVPGIREVADQNRSAGVFAAQVLVAQKAPEYEVAFTGPDGFVRADVKVGTRERYRVGSLVNVRYWPAEHRIERASSAARVFVVFGCLMVVIGAGGATIRIVLARRRKRQ